MNRLKRARLPFWRWGHGRGTETYVTKIRVLFRLAESGADVLAGRAAHFSAPVLDGPSLESKPGPAALRFSTKFYVRGRLRDGLRGAVAERVRVRASGLLPRLPPSC